MPQTQKFNCKLPPGKYRLIVRLRTILQALQPHLRALSLLLACLHVTPFSAFLLGLLPRPWQGEDEVPLNRLAQKIAIRLICEGKSWFRVEAHSKRKELQDREHLAEESSWSSRIESKPNECKTRLHASAVQWRKRSNGKVNGKEHASILLMQADSESWCAL